MPLGFERLNERTKRPNEFINFIKPLKKASKSDEATALEYLSRVAAIVYPIMKANYIAVMALEEFPFNREFAGRNFNAGEVIQLVLRGPTGAWLPFRHVQMVMIHELAHCKEMNHSRAFWKVRNAYADELRALWAKGYTGEGFYGAGRGVVDGRYLRSDIPLTSDMPESLCGGVYRNKGKRRRGGKSSGKPELTWAEKKQRRILKKFGAGGTALGGDEEERQKLEKGKKIQAKPTIAGSVRARELRAAAALARFDQAKKEVVKKEEDSSETESEYSSETEDDSAPTVKTETKELVRVCAGEDKDDENVKREHDEMMGDLWAIPEEKPSFTSFFKAPESQNKSITSLTERTAKLDSQEKDLLGSSVLARDDTAEETTASSDTGQDSAGEPSNDRSQSHSLPESLACGACSCLNAPTAATCIACNNVLDTTAIWDHWQCQSEICKIGVYLNLGDYGRCQICDSKKPH